MCDKQMYHEDLAMVKRHGEQFKAELEKGPEGRYPELAAMIKELRR